MGLYYSNINPSRQDFEDKKNICLDLLNGSKKENFYIKDNLNRLFINNSLRQINKNHINTIEKLQEIRKELVSRQQSYEQNRISRRSMGGKNNRSLGQRNRSKKDTKRNSTKRQR
jgi:hypothetical protein